MNVMVTGGSGFLGSNIVKKLLLEGHKVLVLSRSTNNQHPAATHICSSMSDLWQIESQIEQFNPDVVVHCAWKGGNNYKDVDSSLQYENVIEGVEFLKLLSKLPKVVKFIGFGSFAEYGTLTSQAMESDSEHPTNHYGLAKYAFKEVSRLLCERYGMQWGWIRPCYVYGPNDVSTRLIPGVVNRLLAGESVKLDGCHKLIDYIFVDDFVNFAYSLIMKDVDGVYNLCSGQQYNLRDVMLKIQSLMGAIGRIEFDDTLARPLTSPIICGNNEKIRAQSGIVNLTNLDTGLQKTIEYYNIKI